MEEIQLLILLLFFLIFLVFVILFNVIKLTNVIKLINDSKKSSEKEISEECEMIGSLIEENHYNIKQTSTNRYRLKVFDTYCIKLYVNDDETYYSLEVDSEDDIVNLNPKEIKYLKEKFIKYYKPIKESNRKKQLKNLRDKCKKNKEENYE